MAKLNEWNNSSRRLTLYPTIAELSLQEKSLKIPKLTGIFSREEWSQSCVKKISKIYEEASVQKNSPKGVSELFFRLLFENYPVTYKKFWFFGRSWKLYTCFKRQFQCALDQRFCILCNSCFANSKNSVCSMCGILNAEEARKSKNSLISKSHKLIKADGSLMRKRELNMLATHGVSNVFQLERVKAKRLSSLEERFGVNWQEELLAKKLETVRRKYGVDCVLESPEVRAKSIVTNVERYGVPHPMQNFDIFSKSQSRAGRIKEYELCGRSFKIQSSSERLMYEWLVDKFGIDDVHTQFHEEFPRDIFSYIKTFPDFWVESRDKYVECKSWWTLLGKESYWKENKKKARRSNKNGKSVVWIVHHRLNKQERKFFHRDHLFVRLPKKWYRLSYEDLTSFIFNYRS